MLQLLKRVRGLTNLTSSFPTPYAWIMHDVLKRNLATAIIMQTAYCSPIYLNGRLSEAQMNIFCATPALVSPLWGLCAFLTLTQRLRAGLNNSAPPPPQNAQKRRMFGDPAPALGASLPHLVIES